MTRPIAFSGNTLDRDDRHRKDATFLASALQEDKTRILPVWKLAPLVREGEERRLAWATPAILDGHTGPEPVFLGVADGRAHFAVDISGVANPLVDFGWEGAATFPDLRATVGLLPPATAASRRRRATSSTGTPATASARAAARRLARRTEAGRASAPPAAASTSRAPTRS